MTRAARSPSAAAGARPLPAPRAASTSRSGSRTTGGTARSPRSSSCARLRRPGRYDELRDRGSPSSGARARTHVDARRARGSSRSSASRPGRGRQLLESPTFRALLERPSRLRRPHTARSRTYRRGARAELDEEPGQPASLEIVPQVLHERLSFAAFRADPVPRSGESTLAAQVLTMAFDAERHHELSSASCSPASRSTTPTSTGTCSGARSSSPEAPSTAASRRSGEDVHPPSRRRSRRSAPSSTSTSRRSPPRSRTTSSRTPRRARGGARGVRRGDRAASSRASRS